MKLNDDRIIYAAIGILAFCVYANTLGHGFVYDDNRQILMNPLIQRSELFGKALTSDVWAFKGAGDFAASNYFRPTFVGWLIANWIAFGSAPTGWHVTNVLLHVAVCLLLYAFLRRLGCDQIVGAVIALLFAVHPVHVESVAWISGVTDPLLALFLLVSFIFADRYARDGRSLYLVLSVGTYLIALGSKEVALLCVPLYWLIFRNAGDDSASGGNAIKNTIPFAALAVAFFIVRVWVLGALFLPVDDPIDSGAALLATPQMFVFYLRQIFLPVWIGPALPVRPVAAIDVLNFVLPLVLAIIACGVMWVLARRSFVQLLGVGLFALTLLPAMNAASFGAEHLVHDRYLYLPVAGMLMIIVPELGRVAKRVEKSWVRPLLAVVFVVVMLGLMVKTVSYNSVWASDRELWTYGVAVDPGSAFAWYNLAAAIVDPRESLNANERSLKIRHTYNALVGKARSLIALGDNAGAIAAARETIAADPRSVNAYTLFQAYEMEAYALNALGRFDEAEASLRDARRRLPIYNAALTEKIAVILYGRNQKREALVELEGARPYARTEHLPGSKAVLLRIGMLQAELGNRDAARSALTEFLRATDGMGGTEADRQQAVAILRQL